MLTKPRDPSKVSPTSLYSRKQRSGLSPLMIIGISVPVLLALIGAGLWFALPRLGSHAAAAINMDCILLVPAKALTAQGLATPYQLSATNAANGPCNIANANQGVFVQGVIYNKATGKFRIYNPLVIDAGTKPLVVPVAPTLDAANDVVGLWFGSNGMNTTLKGANANTLANAKCVNGLKTVFGQYAYCNAVNFFAAANQGINNGLVQVPPLGTAADGMPCPTSRDFGVIDQDQSDNTPAQYLSMNGQTAQFSAANLAKFPNATTLGNPSDEKLVPKIILPALKTCQPWTAPDVVDNNTPQPALPLNELQAAKFQQAPIALVPLNDPMAMEGANQSAQKTTLYRVGVDQPPVANTPQLNGNGTTYCQNFVNVGLKRLQLDQTLFANAASPMADVANNLFTFLANRAMQSYTNLGCQNLLNKPNPVAVQMTNNIVTAATITLPGAGNGAAAAQVTVNGTAATFNNGTAQATINQKPATLALNGTALTVTDGAAQPAQAAAQPAQAAAQPAQAAAQPAQAAAQPAQNCQAIKNKKARMACQQKQAQGQGAAAPAATLTVTVNGTAVAFANGQATATINGATATLALNGAALTITDGAAKPAAPAAPNAAVGQITVNGAALTTNQAMLNQKPVTVTNTAGAVTFTDGAPAQATPLQPTGVAITSVTCNGTAATFTNGQATCTVNGAMATLVLTNGNLAATDAAAQPAQPAAPNAAVGQITVNGAALTTNQAMLNQKPVTVAVNAGVVTFTDGAPAQATPLQPAGVAITSISCNGTAATLTNGQATCTINGVAMTTFVLTNGNLAVADAAAQPAAPAAPAGNGQTPAATPTMPAAQ